VQRRGRGRVTTQRSGRDTTTPRALRFPPHRLRLLLHRRLLKARLVQDATAGPGRCVDADGGTAERKGATGHSAPPPAASPTAMRQGGSCCCCCWIGRQEHANWCDATLDALRHCVSALTSPPINWPPFVCPIMWRRALITGARRASAQCLEPSSSGLARASGTAFAAACARPASRAALGQAAASHWRHCFASAAAGGGGPASLEAVLKAELAHEVENYDTPEARAFLAVRRCAHSRQCTPVLASTAAQ
jgi:hypothetical protein